MLVTGVMGCGNSTSPAVLPDLPDPSAASKAMELYDVNHDGFLDAKELEKVPGLKAAIKEVAGEHSDMISRSQIAARIKSWADSGMVRMGAVCRVTHNGAPLAGARVVFVPETFLGGALKSGSGTTSAKGIAMVSAPYASDLAVKGMSPGFYRVEISIDGEIPPEYNRETTLGAEVAGNSEKQKGFDLQY